MINAPINMDTSWKICFANQMIGFYMTETLVFGLKDNVKLKSYNKSYSHMTIRLNIDPL